MKQVPQYVLRDIFRRHRPSFGEWKHWHVRSLAELATYLKYNFLLLFFHFILTQGHPDLFLLAMGIAILDACTYLEFKHNDFVDELESVKSNYDGAQ